VVCGLLLSAGGAAGSGGGEEGQGEGEGLVRLESRVDVLQEQMQAFDSGACSFASAARVEELESLVAQLETRLARYVSASSASLLPSVPLLRYLRCSRWEPL
jgi:hypothetical protein